MFYDFSELQRSSTTPQLGSINPFCQPPIASVAIDVKTLRIYCVTSVKKKKIELLNEPIVSGHRPLIVELEVSF